MLRMYRSVVESFAASVALADVMVLSSICAFVPETERLSSRLKMHFSIFIAIGIEGENQKAAFTG